MKRIGVISDSHGDRVQMEMALLKLEAGGRLDALIHCGDHASDADFIGGNILQVVAVRGNCDGWMDSHEDEMLVDIGGVPIFVTHGHRHGVKQELYTLADAAAGRGARICCFGHTHEPCCRVESGVLMINPGACIGTGDCALITIDDHRRFDVTMMTR